MASMISVCVTGAMRITHHRKKIVAYAGRVEGAKSHAQCGKKLKAKVKAILDVGLLLFDADGTKVFIPRLELQRQIEEYMIGEELELTVARLPVSGTSRDALLATDRPLKSLHSVKVGAIVEGRVLKISDSGVLFDINVPKRGFARWKLLEPLGKDRADFIIGDTIRGLKVRMINPSSVTLGAASLNLRGLKDFKKGEKVRGIVENIAHGINAVFFDIGAPRNAAAFGRKGQLTKNSLAYTHGEETLLEVVKVAGGKISVKDLGCEHG